MKGSAAVPAPVYECDRTLEGRRVWKRPDMPRGACEYVEGALQMLLGASTGLVVGEQVISSDSMCEELEDMLKILHGKYNANTRTVISKMGNSKTEK